MDWLARRNGGMGSSVARVGSCNARSAKEIQVLGEWIVRKGNQVRAAAYGIVFLKVGITRTQCIKELSNWPFGSLGERNPKGNDLFVGAPKIWCLDFELQYFSP